MTQIANDSGGNATKKAKIAAAAKKPTVTPIQLILFSGFIVYLIISNLKWFQDLNPIYSIIIQVSFYVLIMLFKGNLGSINALIGNFLTILNNGDTDNVKVIKAQNLLVAISQQLGLYYEKELEKVKNNLVPKTE